MKIITIGFSKPNTFKIGSWLIQKWIRRSYSHVYIEYKDSNSREMVFQAAHGLVHLITRQNFVKETEIIKEYHLAVEDAEFENFRDFYYDKLGQPYDFFDLIRIVLDDLGIKDIKEHQVGYICSELAATLLEQILGYTLQKPANLMTPKDIDDLLEKI